MKLFGFCQNWIFGQKFDFSNGVYEEGAHLYTFKNLFKALEHQSYFYPIFGGIKVVKILFVANISATWKSCRNADFSCKEKRFWSPKKEVTKGRKKVKLPSKLSYFMRALKRTASTTRMASKCLIDFCWRGTKSPPRFHAWWNCKTKNFFWQGFFQK